MTVFLDNLFTGLCLIFSAAAATAFGIVWALTYVRWLRESKGIELLPTAKITINVNRKPVRVATELWGETWTAEDFMKKDDPKIVMTAKKKRWSKHFDSCVRCGTTERPCHGHGQCARCYWGNYRRPSRRKP